MTLSISDRLLSAFFLLPENQTVVDEKFAGQHENQEDARQHLRGGGGDFKVCLDGIRALGDDRQE